MLMEVVMHASSALAALVANKFAFHDAAVLAKAYVYSGIKHPALTLDDVDALKKDLLLDIMA